MKSFVIVFATFYLLFSNANAQGMKLKPYYDYQFGFETGFGGAGEKNVPFLFGIQAGTFYRISNHQFGARIASFSRGLMFDRDNCMTINAYYGFTFASKMISISPQFGGGYLERFDDIRNNWHKYNLEIALEFALTKNGNGGYIRPFYTWNPRHTYLGITLGGRFGYAWFKK